MAFASSFLSNPHHRRRELIAFSSTHGTKRTLMLQILRQVKPKEYKSKLSEERYMAIIEASNSGQLWAPSGHFYPDCSASPANSSKTFESGFSYER